MEWLKEQFETRIGSAIIPSGQKRKAGGEGRAVQSFRFVRYTKYSLRNEGLSQIFITFTFELGAIPLQDILDIKKRYACLVS